jgi:hypothetical protein
MWRGEKPKGFDTKDTECIGEEKERIRKKKKR